MVRLATQSGPTAFRLLPWLAVAAGVLLGAPSSFAQSPHPGDPLFCQPQEGVTYLITNSGVGATWTADPDCFKNFAANPPNANTAAVAAQTPITTSQGGTLTLTGFSQTTPSSPTWVYTPPSPTFTGVDTFTFNATTEFNAAGGTGSSAEGGTVANNSRPGGPYTFTGVSAVRLNVLPATTTMSGLTDSGPLTVPVPAGSVTGCGPQGNPGAGPPAGAVNGCVTGVTTITGNPVTTAHGTLTPGNNPSGQTLKYTPTPGFVGSDSFSYYATGVNTDGVSALQSGVITMNVNVTLPVPALSPWAIALMMAGLIATGMRMLHGRFV